LGALAPVLTDAFGSNAQVATTGTKPVSQRTERVDELLRQEIGAIVTRDVADPRIGFATITSVETTPDLRHAKVWVSVIGQPEEREATIAALRRAMPFIRHELGSRLRLKRIPDLHINLDDTAERGTRVLRLLSELEAGATPDDEAPVGESLPTPVPRLPQPGDLSDEPPSAVRRSEPDGRKRRRGLRAGGRSVEAPRDGRRTSR
jgi:ribosome-binding factor A